MKKRDSSQRRAYAARRASLAVDRLIVATQPANKEQARRWADAWGMMARYRPAR